METHSQLILNVLRAMVEDGHTPSMSVWNAMISSVGEPETAEMIMDVMQARAVEPPNHLVLTSLLRVYGSCGEHEKARALFERMDVRSSWTYSAMFNSYASARATTLDEIVAVYEAFDADRGAEVEHTQILLNSILPAVHKAAGSRARLAEAKFDFADRVWADFRRAQVRTDLSSFLWYLKIMGDAGRVADLFALMEEMKARRDFHVPMNAYTTMMTGCMKAKNLEAAFDVLQLIPSSMRSAPHLYTYTNLLRACIKLKDFDRAVSVVDMMEKKHAQWDEPVYVLASRLFKHLGLTDRAQRLVDRLRADDDVHITAFFRTVVYNNTIASCAGTGDVARAFQLLDVMTSEHGVAPDRGTITALVEVCCAAGQVDLAFDVLGMMRKKFNIDDLHQNAYNVLIHSLGTLNEHGDRALWLYDDILARGRVPSNFFLSRLLTILARTNHRERAFELLEKMLTDSSFEFRVDTFNLLIRSCVNKGRPDDALKFYRRIVKAGVEPTQKTYYHLIRGMDDVDVAMGLVDEMEENGHVLSLEEFDALLDVCDRADDAAAVMSVFGELKKRELTATPLMFAKVIDRFAKAGHASKVDAILEMLDGDASALGDVDLVVSVVLALGDDLERVDKFLALHRASLDDGAATDPRVLDAALMCAQQTGDRRFANAVWKMYADGTRNHDSYTSMMLVILNAGDVDGAYRHFCDLVELQRERLTTTRQTRASAGPATEMSVRPTRRTYHELIIGAAHHGRLDVSMAVFRQLVDDSDVTHAPVEFLAAFQACLDASAVDEMIEVTQAMARFGFFVHDGHVARALELLGNDEDAKKAFLAALPPDQRQSVPWDVARDVTFVSDHADR